VDTLRGNLDTFGLKDIIGLVAASKQSGALRVSGSLPGRVFFVDGAIVYATTRAEDGSVNDLRGRRTDVTIGERRSAEPPLALPDLLRHQIIDVLVRLMERPGGEFVFDEGVSTTALPAGRNLSFDVSEVLDQAEERIAEWREVRAIVPNPSIKYHLARELPPDHFEVTLDARSWAFLAAISDGVSVETLTERFRIFELAATRKLAEFVRRGLIEPMPTVVRRRDDEPEDAWSGEGDASEAESLTWEAEGEPVEPAAPEPLAAADTEALEPAANEPWAEEAQEPTSMVEAEAFPPLTPYVGADPQPEAAEPVQWEFAEGAPAAQDATTEIATDDATTEFAADDAEDHEHEAFKVGAAEPEIQFGPQFAAQPEDEPLDDPEAHLTEVTFVSQVADNDSLPTIPMTPAPPPMT
jgi:hypothetical protein